VVELDRFVLRQACRQMAGWVADAGPLLLHVQPVRPPPAPQRPGGQRGRGAARLRARPRLPGP
jgi:hypothetical protein